MSNEQADLARRALAGEVPDAPVTVVCDVCARSIRWATARAIPGIGFMCPENAEPKCSPQRTLADMVRESTEQDKQARIDRIQQVIVDCREDLVTIQRAAEAIYEIATDPAQTLFRR